MFFSDESEVLRLDGHEKLALQNRLAGVERDVQPEERGKMFYYLLKRILRLLKYFKLQ
jgi:hypothetical protein